MVNNVAADVRAALSSMGYGSTNVDLTETWSLPNVTVARAEYFKALGASLVRAFSNLRDTGPLRPAPAHPNRHADRETRPRALASTGPQDLQPDLRRLGPPSRLEVAR